MLLAMQHDRLITMIKESITLMCKSTLMYSSELCVEGLLGITLDKRDVFLVNIKEIFQSDNPPPPSVSSSNVTDVSHDTARDDLQVISDGETGKVQHEPPRKFAKHIHRRNESSSENSFQTPHQSEGERPSRVAFENNMAELTSCVETLTSATTSTSDSKFPGGIVIKEEVHDIDFGHENTNDSTVIRDARLSAAVNQSFSSAPFTSTPFHASMYSSAASPSTASADALDTRFSLPVFHPPITSTESPACSVARIFHCQLGSQRKVVRVINSASVLATIRHEFRLKSTFHLQRYDPHWCDWIDVDNEARLKDRCRLRIVVPLTDAVDGGASLRPVEPWSGQQPVPGKEEPVAALDGSLGTEPSGYGDSFLSPASPQLSTDSRVTWPERFQLPVDYFRPDVKIALEQQEMLSRSVKMAFLNVIFQEMLKYTLYPTPKQYKEVALLIVTQYPHLRDTTPGSRGYEVWCTSLSDKFRNARRNMDSQEVMMKRRKLMYHSLLQPS